MAQDKSIHVIFITGAFVGHNCWNEWRAYFERNGFITHAPPWPHKDATPEELRNRHPDKEVASNRLSQLTAFYESYVRQLPENPILIGHSIGGLIVQLLLNKGLGTHGVAIHSVPPQGVITFKFSFLKAGWKALGFFTPTSKSYMMSYSSWCYGFTNGMTCDEQKESYYAFAVPESKLIVRDTITSAAKVDFTKEHAPLLFVSGSSDHTIPSSLNYSNFKRYRNKYSITEYREFPNRNHFVLGQPTWKENAEFILDWIGKTNS